MQTNKNFGLYGIITNPKVGFKTMAEIMVKKKLKYIQLRIKDKPLEYVFSKARALRKIVGGFSKLIINDFVDIALEIKADGVHLGQEDMKYFEARAILGDSAIIGLSTHNPPQTKIACAQNPDYIGVGPVFKTPAKDIPDPVLGLNKMSEMLETANCPAVAIGGINLKNMHSVVLKGAKNICAVREINQSQNPSEVIDIMNKLCN